MEYNKIKSIKGRYMKIDKTILVVDDVESIRESMFRIFNRIFRNCIVAENGEEALTICKNDNIDLIITDIVMPKMDGVTLIKEIRSRFPHIHPLVAITGEASSSQLNEIEELQVKIFKKPIDVDEVEEYIISYFGL